MVQRLGTVAFEGIEARAVDVQVQVAPGLPAFNLFLKDKKGALFLVTALEDAAIELKSLHNRLAAKGRFSFGSPEILYETLGVQPGSVTPFGALNDVRSEVTVVLDEALMSHDTINAHPLTNTMTTTIGRDDLLRFLRATGHEPRIAPVSNPD